jgi:predicted nucleotidyltransferase
MIFFQRTQLRIEKTWSQKNRQIFWGAEGEWRIKEVKNEKLISVLKEFFKKAEGVWIFGSYADGTYNDSSDIDVAVLFKNKKTAVEIFKMKESLELLLKKDVDLVNLSDVNDVFAYEIVTKGKSVKKSDYADSYEYRIWLRYFDLQDDRREIVKEFING